MSDLITENIRNIAIVAHVDHGKTTLIDSILKQSGIFRENQVIEERVMDLNPLEKERGITILAKNTAIPYKGHRINILDTPGHADFSGEVERILNMVDGILLIIDAVEGPMPQTRFVLEKALEKKLKTVVVVNKIDRPASNINAALDKTLDLFVELDAPEELLEFPVIYTIGLTGKSGLNPEQLEDNVFPLLDLILKEMPSPVANENASLQLQVSTLDYNEYLGRILIGRVSNGVIKTGQIVGLAGIDQKIHQAKISKLFTFQGLEKIETSQAIAGDIVAVAGIEDATIGDTIVDSENPVPLERIYIEEPTLEITFSVNSSPFAGQEGKLVTSRNIKERLEREIKTNISLRVEETDSRESFKVSGRGDLHIGILLETMRREGYELEISKPRVLTKEVNGATHEPFEKLVIDVPENMSGACIEELGKRKAEMESMENYQGRSVIEFRIPSKYLLGFRSLFIRMTKGQGIMSSAFLEYAPAVDGAPMRTAGSLIAHETGSVTEYAMKQLEDRGQFYINPGDKVYRGQVIGANTRQQDLVINVCKAKKLTNMRSAGAEVLEGLNKSIEITLEYALDYIELDELIEITPESIRIRKENLNFK